jgi:hypothetical protein
LDGDGDGADGVCNNSNLILAGSGKTKGRGGLKSELSIDVLEFGMK